MACSKHDQGRQTMLNSLTEAFTPFDNLTKHEQFIFVMQCHDWEVIDALSKCQLCRVNEGLYEVLSSICLLFTKPIPH